MNLKSIWSNLSIESQGLYQRLSIIFALFFLVPVSGFLYFSVKYGLFSDEYMPVFTVALLLFSFFGYNLIRRIFDKIHATSKNVLNIVGAELPGMKLPEGKDELQGIVQSFSAIESELRKTFRNLDKKVSQITTLKELSDLCYITFDAEDLFHITLERALKLVDADVGSIMILEGQRRETFVVQATLGLGERLKQGDRVDFATSIAKFAVINKSPLLIDNIEEDTRFGRKNRDHYGTKSFLCMPLKGINEVIGILSLSRKNKDIPFTYEDTDILNPLLSTATFTYDNLRLMRKDDDQARHLLLVQNLFKIVNSSLRSGELMDALLNEIKGAIAFDLAAIMIRNEDVPEKLTIFDFLSSVATNLSKTEHYHYGGSVIDKAIKQECPLFIEDSTEFNHPLERELLAQQDLHACFVSPLKIDGKIFGVLFLAVRDANALRDVREAVDIISVILPLAMEKDRLSESVMKRDRELQSIKQIGSILASSTFNMQEVLRHTMDMIQAIMNAEAGSLMLVENNDLVFKVAFNLDIDVEPLKARRLKLGQGIAGYVAARGEAILVRDVRESQHFNPEMDRHLGFRTRCVLCVPLISQGQVLGVIEIINKRHGDFNDNDLHLLQSIATSVSIALENSRLYQETLSMAEHERAIRNMFQKFVPKEVVEKIVHNAQAEKAVIDELKILTLLNIDLRGFSILSTRLGPQRTVSVLNYFFAAMGELVFRHGGIVDKYLGDGFLAIFGAPVSSIYDADNAVDAALEMRDAMEKVNEYFTREIGVALTIGISVHTGEAVVGNIGFDKKMDYTVIGDSVNVVFRLQELTKGSPNGILISSKTLHAVQKTPLATREVSDGERAMEGLKIFELLGRELQ